MEKKNIEYQFVAVPLNLFYCLDNNLRSMLFTLIQISTYKENDAIEKGKKWDGWFLAANRILADSSNLSENLVRVTLDTLYQKGIINVMSEGKGKGQNTPPNKIKINWKRFKDFEKESIDDCIQDPRLAIETLEYKGSNYHPSYLEQGEVVKTETIMIDDEVNNKASDLVMGVVKSEDNIDNINNKENEDNINSIDNKKSMKESNTNLLPIDSSLPIKEESIGEYQLNQLIKGFSKAKNMEAIIEQFLEVTKHLSRYTNEESEKYISGMKSAIEKRCVELGIDSNKIFNYFN